MERKARAIDRKGCASRAKENWYGTETRIALEERGV